MVNLYISLAQAVYNYEQSYKRKSDSLYYFPIFQYFNSMNNQEILENTQT